MELCVTLTLSFQYYEEDMLRMKREMDDLAAMHSHTASSTSATSAALSVAMRPQVINTLVSLDQRN